jgi:hypothetical protein
MLDYLLCGLTSNITRLEAASTVPSLVHRHAEAADGVDVGRDNVVDELLHLRRHAGLCAEMVCRCKR